MGGHLHGLSRLTAKPSLTKLCVSFIKTLRTPRAVAIKESIQLTGRLDYPHGEILMAVDSTTQLYRLSACHKEPETVEWIEKNMRPGDVLYDIGANVGAYSFVAHTVAQGDCAIYAFEPSFSTFAALCQNVLLNHCYGKIIPLPIALSDETKMVTFNYSCLTPGAALHTLNNLNGGDAKAENSDLTQPTLSYRLDDLVPQFAIRPPNHIKIDVDGAELSVLEGADKTLDDPGLRSILIEIDEVQDANNEIGRYLESKGFRLVSKHLRFGSETLANHIFERSAS